MRQLQFDSPRNVQRSLTRIANAVITGALEPKQANSAIYAASIALSSIRADELERRIIALEQDISALESRNT